MSDDKSDKRAPDGTPHHRRTDLWPVIKANAGPLFLIASVFGSIFALGYQTFKATEFMTPETQEALKFVIETVNPEKMGDWRKRQAVQAAQVKATNDLSNRRWCMAQKLAAKENNVELMKCLNEKVE